MTKTLGKLSVFVLASLLWGVSLLGQVNTGTITGKITDQSGAVVSGATVEITNVKTGVRNSQPSNSEGLFAFTSLLIGDYTVTVTATGFKKFEQTGVRLVSGTDSTINVTLSLGSVSELVTVSGQASTVDTVSTSVGTTRVNEEIKSLPLTVANGRGRMVQSIIRTYPGVNYGTSAYACDLLVGYSNAMNGSNSSAEAYQVDGSSAATQFGNKPQENVGINPEVVDELRLETNPNAEYGSNLGNTVSIVTKSGTNQFHGSAYGYYASDKFNAASWFSNANPSVAQANKRGRLHEAEEGGSLGGRIIKDRLFFFTSWDRYHYRNVAGSATATLPTMKMRAGDFSELLRPTGGCTTPPCSVGTDALGRPIYFGEIYDPASNRPDGKGGTIRDPFMFNGQLNVIDPARLSGPSKVFAAQALPPINFGAPGSLVTNWSGPTAPFGRDSNRETLKLDGYLGKNHLSGGFEILTGFNQVNACVQAWEDTPGIAQTGCVLFNPTNKRWSVSDSVSLSPNMVLEGSFSKNFWTYVVGTCCEGATFGKTMGLQGYASTNVPFMNTQNYSLFGYHIGKQNSLTGTWNIAASLSWVKGKHNLKFGGLYEHAYNTATCDIFANGFDGFSRAETGLPGITGTGWDFASFMLGELDSITVSIPGTQNTSHAGEYGFYGQDSWRVTSKLVVNYGLRWDIGVPGGDCRSSFSTFDSTAVNPAAGGITGALAFYGPGAGNRCSTRNIDWMNLGPRLGLAYSWDSKTVLRAYYGVTYSNNSNGGLGYQATVTRTGAASSQDSGLTPALNWSQPFANVALNGAVIIPPSAAASHNPSQNNNGGAGWSVFSDNQSARALSAGLGVERQLPHQIILKADYVGKFIHGLPGPGQYGGGATALNAGSIQYNAIPLKYLSLGSLLNQSMVSTDPTIQGQIAAAGIRIPYPGFTGTVGQALRPYPQYTSITEGSPSGWSTYNSLQVTAQKHYGSGLSFLLAYTVSKMLVSDVYQANLLSEAKALPMAGSGITDRPQTVNFSYIYELPFGRRKRFATSSGPVLSRFIGGWQVIGSHNYFSGQPLVITGNATTPIIGNQFVVRNPSVPIIGAGCHSQALQNWNPATPNAHLYLTPGAFSDPASFTLGNSRVQPSARDCGVRLENISIMKDTAIKENVHFKIGADLFNAFNRHMWSAPNTNIDSPSYGAITGTSENPRNIQFNARIEF